LTGEVGVVVLGEGGELGMDTMTMPFPIAEGLAINALKVGSAFLSEQFSNYQGMVIEFGGYIFQR